MEELKLLLELGPNLTGAGVEAFGYYVIAKAATSLAVSGVLLTAIILAYKLMKRVLVEDERAVREQEASE